MINVVSNSEMRELDKRAINDFGIPGIVLMENAGRNSAEAILEACDAEKIYSALIFAGKGNNGGDGFVVARYLAKNDIDVVVYLAAKKGSISGDALTNLNICLNSGIKIVEINSVSQIGAPTEDFIIVDALLGTGVTGPAKNIYALLIDWINGQKNYTFSIDIPSGLSGDFTEISGPVVEAHKTLTMGLPKLSPYFFPASSYVGELEVIDIGFPKDVEEDPQINIHLIDESDLIFDVPVPDLNKHSAGRVFIVGASTGMTGAVVLAAKGASLAGAGLVTCGVAESLNPILENKLTEQMSIALPEIRPGVLGEHAFEQVKEKIDWCHCVLIGPGIGRDPKTFELIGQAILYSLEQKKKIVIDADALFFLSTKPELIKLLTENVLLTPHHGEFGRLFPNAKKALKNQPWKALQDFNKYCKAITNLKGAPSMVGQKDDGVFINSSGNPGLAKGGSGDLLAGMIAGFAVGGMELLEAAVSANFIHGKAADYAAEKWGMRSFTLEDLMDEIKLVFKELY